MFDLNLSAACAKPSAEEQILFSCKGVVAKAACGRKSKRSQTSASSLKNLKTSYPTHTGKIWEDLGRSGKYRVPPKPRLVILVLAECYSIFAILCATILPGDFKVLPGPCLVESLVFLWSSSVKGYHTFYTFAPLISFNRGSTENHQKYLPCKTHAVQCLVQMDCATCSLPCRMCSCKEN